MANYFQRVFEAATGIRTVRAELLLEGMTPSTSDPTEPSLQLPTTSVPEPTSTSLSTDISLPWYIIPVPEKVPIVAKYDPKIFTTNTTFNLLCHELRKRIHFSMKYKDTGHEGLYGVFQHVQLPDIEFGLDIDIASFIAGTTGCILLGLYFNDIYYPRKIFVWWPTRWFFEFTEEGMYLNRSARWFVNFVKIFIKILIRGVYGGLSHCISRMIYFYFREKLFGSISYKPLFDETFAAMISGYLWTESAVRSEQHTFHNRIIYTGWIAIITGLIEYSTYQYFEKEPSPGLFRWFFGGAFYGPGVWRYLVWKPKN